MSCGNTPCFNRYCPSALRFSFSAIVHVLMSDYMIDSVPSKIPNTVINSLNKKGLLNGRECIDRLQQEYTK